jgi:hypothetical protein
MTYTTADCTNAIINYMPIDTVYYGEPRKPWRRDRKFKDCKKQVTRIFTAFVQIKDGVNAGKYMETWLWVVETPDGLIVREGTPQEREDFRIHMYGSTEEKDKLWLQLYGKPRHYD